MSGPRLVRWDQPGGQCPGCAGCSIRRALSERDTFTRGDVAHLIALAFRSGAQLAHDMAEDIENWARNPVVQRSAARSLAQRRSAMDEGAARQRAVFDLATQRRRPIAAGQPTGLGEFGNVMAVGEPVDPDLAWPEVATPGGSGDA